MSATSDLNIREIAVMRAGRSVAPSFACGYGEPAGDNGVDLLDSILSVVQFVREPKFAGNGFTADYIVLEGALGVPTSVYELDMDGTSVAHTVVAGDTAATVIDSLLSGIAALAPDYEAKRLTWRVNGAAPVDYHGIRTLRPTSTVAAPSVTSGGNLVHRGAPATDTEYRVWLRQTLADGEQVWSAPVDGLFTLSAGNGVERLATAGFDRIYIEAMSDPSTLGSYQEAYAAPCIVTGG